MRIRTLVAGMAAAVLAGLGLTSAPAAHADSGVTVAVLDSGVYAAHQEFAGVPITFKDFVGNGAQPYDDLGHGTLTASMIAGQNVSPAKTPSMAPGTRLLVGKVLSAANVATDAAMANGIAWAVNNGADIISMSIGNSAPASGLLAAAPDVKTALGIAHDRGVLVVVSNGNGVENHALPGYIGPLQTFGNSPLVLAVGASGLDGLINTYEPEVVAQYTVTGPSNTDAHGYVSESGTSFSAPLVAGYAAHALSQARLHGRTWSGDQLESLVKACARDTVLPPTVEGYGVIDAGQLPCVDQAAATGAIPGAGSVNQLWVESVSGTIRALFG